MPDFAYIDERTRSLLHTFGFDRETFEKLRQALRSGVLPDNTLQQNVEPVVHSDVNPLGDLGGVARSEDFNRGVTALQDGRVGLVILAGGMATRFGGVVKATVPVVDDRTFLDLKLQDAIHIAKRHGAVVPVYLMSSFATDAPLREAITTHTVPEVPVEVFPQFISLRLTDAGELFADAEGQLSPYAPGHGDLAFALKRSGALNRFQQRGGEILLMSNVDNLTATLDPAVIGAHLRLAEANGSAITVEVAPKHPGDKGGAPAKVNGIAQIVESFRFPPDFDQDTIPVFNTNTIVFDAAALAKDIELTWFKVNKTVGGQGVIQFERLVGELTGFVPTSFLGVQREGEDARFQPVKDPAELERRRAMIVDVLKRRGSL